jgi:hypothetical protein
MLKHNFKMRCENRLIYYLGFVYFHVFIFNVISRLLLLLSRARRKRCCFDKGL